MQGHITKKASDVENFKNDIIFYESARKGLLKILKKLKREDYTILIPAFIGFSINEGSGIFDPITETKIEYEFYNMNENIEIDFEDLKFKMKNIEGKFAVLLVHYFGYADIKLTEIINEIKNSKGLIIEDCAHALYTDFIDDTCGSLGDVSFYSLHKMLPYNDGGMIKINSKEFKEIEKTDIRYDIYNYNLKKIADIRKRNAQILNRELKNVDSIKILRDVDKYNHCTPQTFPIIIREKDKNELYHILNNAGYGVISLYHTMINELQSKDVPVYISKRILNLPVHQDAPEDELIKMCEILKQELRK